MRKADKTNKYILCQVDNRYGKEKAGKGQGNGGGGVVVLKGLFFFKFHCLHYFHM